MTNACLVGTYGFVSLKLVLVSACLMPLHQVGARVKLTLRPLSLHRVFCGTLPGNLARPR